MFERFTAKARRTVVLAQEEARLLNHNYIGTEHILLGLIHEAHGIGPRVLTQFGLTLEGAREEVTAIVGPGKQAPSGHIPFTPRAKKTLELSLREALQLHHNYIGTEHILLGLIREEEGVAAQVLRKHGDLLKIRLAVLDVVETPDEAEVRGRSWLRRVTARLPRPGELGDEPAEEAEQSVLSATPAADETLSTAARLAGGEPVGSHHLLLAALQDANSAAARVLSSLGVDLTRAKDALHNADISGTSDELPEEAGRRQMNLTVSGEVLTIVAVDEALVKSANAALTAIRQESGEDAAPGGTIRGADLSGLPATHLAKAWTALHDALSAIADMAQAAVQEDVRAKAKAEAIDEAVAKSIARTQEKGKPEADPPAETA